LSQFSWLPSDVTLPIHGLTPSSYPNVPVLYDPLILS
jgi:hypothetical protein